ncbi:hypothetical protein, partial [Pseudomonas aeruginosa]
RRRHRHMCKRDRPWLRLAAAVLLALFAAGAVRQSVVNRRPMENRS